MEYPFKDLLPLDEVLEREGYYKDWTHLDPEVFYSLTQISEYIKTKGYGVDVRLLIAQLAEHFGLKTTQVVDLANLLQQKFENLEGVTQSFTDNINSLVAQMEADKNAVIANATVDSEVILSRGDFDTLGDRLDEQVALTYNKIDEATVSIRSDLVSNSDNLTIYKENGYVDIVNRASTIYSVIDANNTTTITSSGYVSGSDFAVLLSEKIPAGKSVKIRIKGSLEASRTIILRFGGSTQLSYMSPFNTVNEVVLSNSESNPFSSYVYFDFMGNAKLEIEDIEVVYQDVSEAKSIYEIEQRAKPYEYVSLNSGAIEKLIKTATTYLQNLSSLTYGNSNTLYDPTVSLVGGKFQIDCSSFFSALYQGVPYTGSRYVKSDNSTSRWGFTTYDPRRYRYANQLAKFANKKGYGFEPKSDLSDLRAGDVLFFSWSGAGGDVEFKSRAWMGIQHVGIFLDKEDTGRYSTLQLDNGFTNVIYMADETYMQQCVYVARFPIANVDSEFTRSNLIEVGQGEHLNNTGLSCNLKEPLKKYSFYTLVVDYEMLTPDRRLIIQNAEWKIIAAHTQVSVTGRRTSVYRILYNHDDSETLKVSIEGSGDGRANFYGQQLYKGFPIFD